MDSQLLKVAVDEARVLAHITGGFQSAVRDRILPTFANISGEARVVYEANLAQERHSQAAGDLPPEWEAGLEAQAYDYAMRSAQQTLLNGLSIVLWHYFQQSFVAFAQRLTQHPASDLNNEFNEYREALLQQYGIQIKRLENWPKLHELWLAANAMKHGDGDSCAELQRRRPDLFRRKYQEQVERLELLSSIGVSLPVSLREAYEQYQKRLRVVAPLSQYEIVIDEAEVASYCVGIVAFWKELAIELELLAKRH